MPTTRSPVHSAVVPIRWGDMDALGHVNNTAYFRYMEQARMEWLGRIAEAAGRSAAVECVIVNASCTFHVPLEHPGTVEVRMYAGPPGRSSFDTFYELWVGSCKHAEGAARIVWVDRGTQRSTPLPDAVRALLT